MKFKSSKDRLTTSRDSSLVCQGEYSFLRTMIISSLSKDSPLYL